MSDQERLRWIYTDTYQTNIPAGMRTWHGEWRADIKFENGKYLYYLTACFGDWNDPNWTVPREADNVFEAMRKAEEWIREHVVGQEDNYDPSVIPF